YTTNTYHFFFSSRRRHTRFKCDWSSDVCSSDLAENGHRLALPLKAEVSQGYTVLPQADIRSIRHRQHMRLVRRNAAVQCVEIDPPHSLRPACIRDREPAIEPRGKVAPRRPEPGLDAARPPRLG